MALKKLTLTDGYGNSADVEEGRITQLNVSLEGFVNIDDFAKEVRQAMVKTTPDGQELDPIAKGARKERKPRGKKIEKAESKRGRTKDKASDDTPKGDNQS